MFILVYIRGLFAKTNDDDGDELVLLAVFIERLKVPQFPLLTAPNVTFQSSRSRTRHVLLLQYTAPRHLQRRLISAL